MMSWVVVQVNPTCEEYATNNLKSAGFNAFNPKLVSQKDERLIYEPLFRGYIVVEIDLEDVGRWRTIRSYNGVTRILGGTPLRPATLPIGFVEDLMERCPIMTKQQDPIKLAKGDKIKFTSGAFKDITGIVNWTNGERASLLVRLLGSDMIIQTSARLLMREDA